MQCETRIQNQAELNDREHSCQGAPAYFNQRYGRSACRRRWGYG